MNRLRQFRKDRNLRQHELAAAVGLSQQAISFWEDGSREPTLENKFILARYFGVSVHELFPSYKLPTKKEAQCVLE